MTDIYPICHRCGKPVVVNQESYDVFEGMHWLCFHLEFEHSTDPDEPCADPACPWWHIQIYRTALENLGHNPQEMLDQAIVRRWKVS